MKIGKNIGKTAVLFAIAAAGVLTVGSASAAGSPFTEGGTGANLTVHNYTKGCVRFYLWKKDYVDVLSNKSEPSRVVTPYHRFQASVFSGSKCGGKAATNVYFNTMGSGSVNDWAVK